MLFFELSTWMLFLSLIVVVMGATAIGWRIGMRVRDSSADLHEPFPILQGALLAFMALVLAFALSLAVDRYEARRAAVVNEANTIGTTYLRAQTIAEPQRTQSLVLLRNFSDTSIDISRTVLGSAAQKRELTVSDQLQRDLWRMAGQALDLAPTDTAPRLYVESLNEMFDSQSTRVATLGNRVPTPVLVLEVIGKRSPSARWPFIRPPAAAACVMTTVVAAGLVVFILVVSFDLDRPTRGLIRVPVGPLVQTRADMVAPPDAPAPTHR